jgi:hypothetical protein
MAYRSAGTALSSASTASSPTAYVLCHRVARVVDDWLHSRPGLRKEGKSRRKCRRMLPMRTCGYPLTSRCAVVTRLRDQQHPPNTLGPYLRPLGLRARREAPERERCSVKLGCRGSGVHKVGWGHAMQCLSSLGNDPTSVPASYKPCARPAHMRRRLTLPPHPLRRWGTWGRTWRTRAPASTWRTARAARRARVRSTARP